MHINEFWESVPKSLFWSCVAIFVIMVAIKVYCDSLIDIGDIILAVTLIVVIFYTYYTYCLLNLNYIPIASCTTYNKLKKVGNSYHTWKIHNHSQRPLFFKADIKFSFKPGFDDKFEYFDNLQGILEPKENTVISPNLNQMVWDKYNSFDVFHKDVGDQIPYLATLPKIALTPVLIFDIDFSYGFYKENGNCEITIKHPRRRYAIYSGNFTIVNYIEKLNKKEK